MSNKKGICIRCLFYHTGVERFELPSTVLETGALPLNYTPIFCFLVYLENHIYYYTSKLLFRQYLTVNFLSEVLLRFAQKNDLPTRTHTSFGFASAVFIKSPDQVSRSNPRPISTGQLHTLLYFHTQPIYLVVFKGSYFL